MLPGRRKFIRQLGGTAALMSAASIQSLAYGKRKEEIIMEKQKRYAANDKVRLACIGMGIQGYNDIDSVLKTPGTELVACCDLYAGRLDHAKEIYGDHIFTTGRYEEILDRPDVDAILLATNDSWHSIISIEAMKKGKAVYCEKPMVHQLSQGWDVINAQRQTGMVMQVGSQGVSSLGFAKAKELFEAGEIGTINSVEAVNTRQSFLGAWEYTIPLDASTATVDWERFQSNQKKKFPYEDKRFFWWRNYREYGTGVAGDLFVHLLSGLHFITGSKGPSKIFSIADLSFWKDGRDVPDIMNSLLQYPATKEHPAFQVTLSVNFASGEGESGYTKITGTDGVMFISEDTVKVKRKKMPKAPGIGGWDSMHTYTKDMQAKLLAHHNKKYQAADQESKSLPDIIYKAPAGYNHHADHLANFIDSVRSGKPVVEDAVFGFRAAAPCLACNESYFQNKIIEWDPEGMKLV